MFDKIKGFLGVNDDEYDDYPDEDMFPSRASAPVVTGMMVACGKICFFIIGVRRMIW